LGDILVTVWGILWVLALIPAWASLYNKYRVEYPTILLVTAGVAIYAANIWAQVPGTHTRTTQALTVTALAVGLTLRWLNRRRLVAWDKNRNARARSEEHTSELQSRFDLVCRLLLEKKNKIMIIYRSTKLKIIHIHSVRHSNSSLMYRHALFFFSFSDTAITAIYTLSLHDALPISQEPTPGPHKHSPSQPWP